MPVIFVFANNRVKIVKYPSVVCCLLSSLNDNIFLATDSASARAPKYNM